MMDMTPTIVPKSDQINADDLLSGPITIKLTNVKVSAGQEQPVSMFFEGSEKAFRPCKSMCRVIVSAWGADTSKYIGRSLTLYCDPTVKWGGMAVGGIRISHMTDIESSITMALTMTRANKKPFTVKPLKGTAAAQGVPDGKTTKQSSGATTADPVSAAAHITADQALALESLCTDNGISVERLKKAAKVERISLILADDFERSKAWITAAIASAKPEAELQK